MTTQGEGGSTVSVFVELKPVWLALLAGILVRNSHSRSAVVMATLTAYLPEESVLVRQLLQLVVPARRFCRVTLPVPLAPPALFTVPEYLTVSPAVISSSERLRVTTQGEGGSTVRLFTGLKPFRLVPLASILVRNSQSRSAVVMATFTAYLPLALSVLVRQLLQLLPRRRFCRVTVPVPLAPPAVFTLPE